jgi:tRNA (mo5U34)-methyltransferase
MKQLKTRFTRDQIERRARDLGEWFHNLNLDGVQTAPFHFLGDYPAVKWKQFEHTIPRDMRGKSVLDVGCNGGFYSLEMKRRGADRVVAIDHDEDYLKQARFAAEVCDLDIEFHQLSVYDVSQLNERFDLVLFLGVFYHLRYPLLALDHLHEHVVKDLFVFQSLQRGSSEVDLVAKNYPFEERNVFRSPGFPQMYFIENAYANDPTNWWIPNRACVEAMLRSAGFDIIHHPENEVFVCRWSPPTRHLP